MNQTDLEKHFLRFRKNTIGYQQQFETPYGRQTMHYFDWTASGRLYGPIEDALTNTFGPFVGNTHSESSETGTAMTAAYHEAQAIIKKHVNADANDRIIATGTGATGGVMKLQRILGLKFADQLAHFLAFAQKENVKETLSLPEELKPVVFVTHMEHHSNQTSWVEAFADVVVLETDADDFVDPEILRETLKKYADRKIKIGAFTACSNVTGILTPIHQLAKIMHEHGGYCFVDFAAGAPYITINMHPENPLEKLDAIYFSPHKFLGGPGTPGILIFNKELYPQNLPPDHPGGGTVQWTNPWSQQRYYDDIETREDGGTPGFLQTIKAALAIKLKEEMGSNNILAREEMLLEKLWTGLSKLPKLHILDSQNKNRIGIVSFYVEDIHYNLIVKLLNDRYGIQVRGGCSCAGTYGHCLLKIGPEQSRAITDVIDTGDNSTKPGWVRISLHPTLLTEEVDLILTALQEIIQNSTEWKKDYTYNSKTNEFTHSKEKDKNQAEKVKKWFRNS